jgi:hypothetical protein
VTDLRLILSEQPAEQSGVADLLDSAAAWPVLVGAAFVMQIRRWWSITFLVCP